MKQEKILSPLVRIKCFYYAGELVKNPMVLESPDATPNDVPNMDATSDSAAVDACLVTYNSSVLVHKGNDLENKPDRLLQLMNRL